MPDAGRCVRLAQKAKASRFIPRYFSLMTSDRVIVLVLHSASLVLKGDRYGTDIHPLEQNRAPRTVRISTKRTVPPMGPL